MLLAEAEGRPYSKANHRRALISKLDGRTEPSVERKHQNISAVLIELGIGPIDGYKPLGNYQRLLAEEVRDYIAGHQGMLTRLARLNAEVPEFRPLVDREISSLIVEPPEHFERVAAARQHGFAYAAKVDFAQIDQHNRRLGELGERFVMDFEHHRLLSAGRDDLARRIDWVAQSKGDGLGYDIVSFDDRTDSERLIEVKTTNQGMRAPFYITSNELSVSEKHPEAYRLYRVFRFSKEPRLFVLQPPLSSQCDLEPALYRACF